MVQQIYWSDPEALETIESELRENRLVAGTSDTIPGLLAPVTKEGFESLNRAKNRKNKPYLILVPSIDGVTKFVDHDKLLHIEKLLRRAWPGPLTVILPACKDVPTFAQSPNGTIAIRVPDHQGLLKLLKRFDGLFSTSANKAGQAIAQTPQDIDPEILQHVTYVVLDGKQKENKLVSSTILDCTGPDIKVIREGAFSISDVEELRY